MIKARKRITKQELKEDKLVTYTFKVNAYIRENARKISTIILGSIAVILIISFIHSSQESSEMQAMSEVGIAQNLYQVGDYANARITFDGIINEYDGTDGAGMSVYFAGDCCFKLGEFAAARNYFQQYLDDYKNNDILTASAISGIAACLEEDGNYLQAAEQYKQAFDKFSESFNAPKYLIDMGRCYELAGMKNEAEITYKRVIEDYSSSIYVREATLAIDLL